MRTPEDHVAAIAATLGERRTELTPLADALGRALAEPVTAAFDSPRFDNSQMDGYALGQEHLDNPGFHLTGATLAAGTDPQDYYPNGIKGTIVPIMTGARLPEGTVAVVPVEACDPPEFTVVGETVSVPPADPGQFVRRAGSDITAGELLLDKGTVLTPAAIGTLASQGIEEVTCFAPARLVICTGGKEIGEPGAASIPDSNGPMLRAQARAYGMEVVASLRTNDEPEALHKDLEDAVAEHAPDAIVTSGGISHGKFEVVRQVLEANGWFGHVDQQPGGPQGIAEFQGTPVICLPGNPVSTLVSFRLFVAPLLGTVPTGPDSAQVDREMVGLDNRDQFLRGTLNYLDGRVTASPTGGAGSHLLAQAAAATALLRIPAGARLAAGEAIDVYPL